jgi:phage terminase large subunit-like protein
MLSEAEANALLWDWEFWARPNQLIPPDDWYIWLILAGRGFGKTRTGAESVRKWVKNFPLVNLIGATADDARDIMIEGESGILRACPDSERPEYKKTERKLLWPNGAKTLIFTADEPDRLRGKQHMKLWADEVASWRYPDEAWGQAMLGLRLGDEPQGVITTTPKPIKLIKELIADPRVHVTRGTTYENRANLAKDFYGKIITRYEGTRLGRQELNAEVLEDIQGALWQRSKLDELRVKQHPELFRIVVSVDPEASNSEDSAETGIIVSGIARVNGQVQGYVLDDLSIKGSPNEWATAAVTGYYKFKADLIVAEVNQGGDMVEATIHVADPNVPVKKIHASRGKVIRAEPVSALYEKARVHHVGFFPDLEDQLCEWVPGNDSPDRLDALVHGLTELMLQEEEHEAIIIYDPLAEIENELGL